MLVGILVNYINKLKDEVLNMIDEFVKLNRPFDDKFKQNVRSIIDDNIVNQTAILQ